MWQPTVCGGAGPSVDPHTRRHTPVVVIVDTDVTLWPDPGERTWVRLGSLQHLIARFEEETGRVPARLEEVLPRGEAPAYMSARQTICGPDGTRLPPRVVWNQKP
jgi:hypothetical protein